MRDRQTAAYNRIRVLKRTLKYLNIAILLLLAAAAGVVYWFAWRVLPVVSGTLEAPVSARATITRDALGVPEIQAASIDDALFLNGYAAAQDRLWQMDVFRRAAAGRLSEIFGAGMLELDREARRLRIERIAEAHAATLPAPDRAVLAAYARGVNFFIERNRSRLPLEFTLLGYEPRPWRVADSVLIGLFMYRMLTTTWPQELQKSRLLAGGDAAKVAVLFPSRAGTEVQPGSNAWVLAGSRTATGKPILANDPHLEWSLPTIWLRVHLKAPGLDVTGAAIPGLPCVIIGHNDRIAWGVTNLQFDVQDFFIEKLDTQLGRYEYRGASEQARIERDLIPVKGGRPVEFTQLVTRHGAVVREGNQYVALRWAAGEPGSFAFPFLDLDRARNFEEFTSALARYPGPGQNFVYADVDGNIGYQATGRLPVRRNHDGDVPVDGASGNFEWDGFIPFDKLPRVYNPPAGLIVTANQNPFPADYPYRVSGNFASPYRAGRIRELLAQRTGWRPDEMLPVQTDIRSEFLLFVGREIVAAYMRRGVNNPAVAEAIELLRKWDGRVDQDVAAPLIALLASQHLEKAIAERASPGGGAIYNIAAAPNERVEMAPAVLERLLRDRPKDWFADYDQVLLESFADAVEEGRRMQGRDIGGWRFGVYNRLIIPHPVYTRLPVVGKYFAIGPLPQSGSSTTVKQTTTRIGPSMRMIVDLSDWDNSLMNIATGISGQALSSHFRDQWEAHYEGRSFPMHYRRAEVENTLTVVPLQQAP